MALLGSELRGAIRSLWRGGRLTLAAVLTLSVGVGMGASTLSAVRELLWQGPAWVQQPEQVFYLNAASSYAQLEQLRDAKAIDVAAYTHATGSLVDGLRPVSVRLECVSGNYFQMLGVPAQLGRVFNRNDDVASSTRVLIFAHAFWERHASSDASIVGRSVALGNKTYDVIGVAPPEFRGVEYQDVDAWLVLDNAPEACSSDGGVHLHDSRASWLQLLGRLRMGASREQADAEVGLVTRGGAVGRPAGRSAAVQPLLEARQWMLGQSASVTRWLAGGGALLLLIACANVAGLLSIRVVDREREISIRHHLGASPGRVFAQFLMEHLIVALACGLVAILVSFYALALLSRFLPISSPLIASEHALELVGLFTLAAGLLAGIVPALHAASHRRPIWTQQQGNTPSGGAFRSGLLVAQTGFGLVLIVCAVLFSRSLGKVLSAPGYELNRVRVVSLDLERAGYRSLGEIRSIFDQAATRLKRLEGVEKVSVSFLPVLGSGGPVVEVPMRGSREQTSPFVDVISSDYFSTIGTKILHGRSLNERDDRSARAVAVIDKTTADALWPSDDALGKCLPIASSQSCVEIVGVSESRRHLSIARVGGEVFLPEAQAGRYFDLVPRTILVRVKNEDQVIDDRIVTVITSVASRPVVVSVHSLAELAESQAKLWSAGATLFGVFSIVAVFLITVGTFSLLTFSVRKRLTEIGIRLALGAQSGQVMTLVLRQSGLLIALGIAIGLVGAVTASQLIRAMLFGVEPTDWVAYVAACTVIVASGLAASVAPALRASRMDPAVLLRDAG